MVEGDVGMVVMGSETGMEVEALGVRKEGREKPRRCRGEWEWEWVVVAVEDVLERLEERLERARFLGVVSREGGNKSGIDGKGAVSAYLPLGNGRKAVGFVGSG